MFFFDRELNGSPLSELTTAAHYTFWPVQLKIFIILNWILGFMCNGIFLIVLILFNQVEFGVLTDDFLFSS